jgi:hypothetical protein
MAADPRRALVIAHIESVSRRPAREGDRLVATMLRRCWPGGDDRTEPGAREWLRRWRPSHGGAAVPSCTCPRGACLVCN